MTNPRDTGRYDAITDTWIDQQVRIDFAWGNIPLQPNDDRGEDTLDPLLDSHIIAVAGYQNFPSFTPGAPFDDTLLNVTVPDLVGLEDPTAAEEALAEVGLVLGNSDPSQEGANSGNNLSVKSQSPAAGTVVNLGSTVDIVVYDNPGVAVPNLAGMGWNTANTAITNAGFVVGTSTTATAGANDTNVNKVKSQSPTAGTLAAPGSTVTYVLYSLPESGTVAHMEWDAGSNRYFFYPVATTDYVSTNYVGYAITIANFAANHAAEGVYVIDEIVADNAWNTGGQKIWLRKGAFTWTGAGTSGGSTWTLGGTPIPAAVYGPTTDWATITVMSNGAGIALGSNLGPTDPSQWAAVVANPSGYQLVISGGSGAGTYSFGYAAVVEFEGQKFLSVRQSNMNGLGLTTDIRGVTCMAMPFMGRPTDAGIASIVAV